jgi:hypothetical protein
VSAVHRVRMDLKATWMVDVVDSPKVLEEKNMFIDIYRVTNSCHQGYE